MVKVDEGSGDGKGEWIHEMLTAFFETEWKLHGQEVSRKLIFFSPYYHYDVILLLKILEKK